MHLQASDELLNGPRFQMVKSLQLCNFVKPPIATRRVVFLNDMEVFQMSFYFTFADIQMHFIS